MDGFQEDEVAVWARVWPHVSTLLLALFVGLAAFTVALEIRMRLFRKTMEVQQTQLEPLVVRASSISAQEDDVKRLMQFKRGLDDWRKARIEWAEWLGKMSLIAPTNLTLKRVNVRGVLAGSFTRPDPFLPARFVPARTFRIEIEGFGRDAETAGAVSTFATALSLASREAKFPLQVKMQGLEKKPVDGAAVREFSLLAVGPAGAEP